MYIVNVVVKI